MRARLAAQAQRTALGAFQQLADLRSAAPYAPGLSPCARDRASTRPDPRAAHGRNTAPLWSRMIASGLPSAGRSTRPIICR